MFIETQKGAPGLCEDSHTLGNLWAVSPYTRFAHCMNLLNNWLLYSMPQYIFETRSYVLFPKSNNVWYFERNDAMPMTTMIMMTQGQTFSLQWSSRVFSPRQARPLPDTFLAMVLVTPPPQTLLQAVSVLRQTHIRNCCSPWKNITLINLIPSRRV